MNLGSRKSRQLQGNGNTVEGMSPGHKLRAPRESLELKPALQIPYTLSEVQPRGTGLELGVCYCEIGEESG